MKLLQASVSQKKVVLRALIWSAEQIPFFAHSHTSSPVAASEARERMRVRSKAFREWQATGIKPDGQKRSLLMGKSGGSKSRAGLFLRRRSLPLARALFASNCDRHKYVRCDDSTTVYLSLSLWWLLAQKLFFSSQAHIESETLDASGALSKACVLLDVKGRAVYIICLSSLQALNFYFWVLKRERGIKKVANLVFVCQKWEIIFSVFVCCQAMFTGQI